MSEKALDDWKRPAPIGTCGDGEDPLVALLELYALNGQRPLPASKGRVCQLVGAASPWAEGQVEQALRHHFRPTRAGWVFDDQEPRSQEGG